MVLDRNQAIMLHPKLVRETIIEIKKYHEENPELNTIEEEGLVFLEKALRKMF